MSTAKKVTHKRKQITHRESWLAGYRRGLNDRCRHCRSELIARLTTTNAELWESLNVMDESDPIKGIVLSFHEAELVKYAMRRGKQNHKLAAIIHKRIMESPYAFPNIVTELENISQSRNT